MDAAASPASSTNRAAEAGSAGSSADSAASTRSSRAELVIKRLIKRGLPANYAERGPEGLIEYVKGDQSRVPEVVAALFPDHEEIKDPNPPADETQASACRTAFLGMCVEAVFWAQWLMFGRDPKDAFADTAVVNSGARGICGAVWGSNDIAYRCRTCEHDPTCAICVPCFKAGDHRNHDYSMIRTGGGCCDCGDVTAWKQSGFCSNHKGPGHVPSLPVNFVVSAAPVLEAVLAVWVSRLEKAHQVAEGKPKKWSSMTTQEKVASQTSLAVIKMLLELCCAGESMLSFTAKYAGMKSIGILDALLKTESFMSNHVIDSLHELLYKLLGDTSFKHAFALTFISHYPRFMRDSVTEELSNPSNPNSVVGKNRDHAVLSNFSVQIFTVPTLTPKLVLESKLLDMLVAALRDFLVACVGEDGRLVVSKGPIIVKLYARVTEDIRYVMTHFEVAQYVTRQRKDLCKAWLELLAFVQGMHPQRRVTSVHVEEENDDWDSAYCLEVQMATIHPLFVLGAASASGSLSVDGNSLPGLPCVEDLPDEDDDNMFVRHAKVGRISPKETNDMDTGSTSGADVEMADVANSSCAGGDESLCTDSIFGVRTRDGRGAQSMVAMATNPLIWLISECVSILDKWLALDNFRELAKGPGKAVADSGPASVQHRGTLWRGRARGLTRGTARTAAVAEPAAPAATPPAVVEGEGGPGRGLREWLRRSRRPYAAIAILDEDRGNARASGVAASGTDSADMDVDVAGVSETVRSRDSGTEWWMCTDDSSSLSRVGQCSADGWPKLDFDVSRQDVSFHIPLHRMLALLLHKALELHSANLEPTSSSDNTKSTNQSPLESISTLSQLLPPKYQVPGFAASLMEHPLRLQVLCAQVQAGMWRRNGHPTSTICDLYRTVPWCEDSLELDLLILQCCAVMAPPEKFVDRIQSRFGLSEYFTLFLWRPNEYDSSLAQEFLVLLIRICTERGFCGLTQKESLRRELIQRLAVGDATHSSLLKALPRRLQDSKYLHECLTAVANYRRPSGMQQGKYVLKEECWSELDLYHPRWSPRELQSAEERYLRACKASPVYLQLPRWKMPFAPLQKLGRFVVSEKVHEILHSVFFHAAFSNNPGDSRATEGLLFTALHLLALALDVCSSASYKYEQDSSANVVASSLEGFNSNLPYLENLNSSMFRVSSPKHASVEEENDLPPLLARSIHRQYVGGAGGSDAGMTERQSVLSLLGMLLRKYGSGQGVMGTVVETSQYGAGDLIKSLLLKFADLHRGCMYEIESLVPEILHRPSVALNSSSSMSSAGDKDSVDKQAVTDAEKRKTLARERQKAIMAKMKAAQDRFVASLQDENSEREKAEAVPKQPRESVEVGEGSSEDADTTLCALCRDTGSSSPLCFLTLVQKSRLLALAQKPTPSWERASATIGVSLSERGNDAARNASEGGNVEMYTTADLWNWIQDALGDAATRERLLEGEALLEVFRNGLHPGIRNAVRLANAVGTPPTRAVEPVETEVDEPEANGENSEIETCPEAVPLHSPNWWEQDPGPRGPDERTSSRELNLVTVLAEYVAAVSRDRRRQGEREVPRTVEVEVAREGGAIRGRRMPARSILEATVNTGLGMNDTSGVYLSACGHAVHQECLDRYVSSLLQRYYSRALFEGVQIVDPDMGEFLCPVCRRLANSILPAFSGNTVPDNQRVLTPREPMEIPDGEQDFSASKVESSSSTKLQLDQAFRLLLNAEWLVNKTGYRKAVSTQLPDSIKGALETLAVRLYGLFHPDKDHLSGQAHGRVPQSLHLWDVFRYSLMSSELAARTRQSTTQGSLSGLVLLEEGGDGAKGSILPLLLQAAKATQGQSRQVVLLRSRGLQLLVDSIVHGVTRDPFPEQVATGSYISLQQYLEKSQDSADVQFWKRLADPVLTLDPFSSLIWLLFCLPAPLPPFGPSFSVLVHLFYMVCLTQVIAYHGIALASEAEVGSSVPSFVTAIQAALSGAALSPLDDDKSVIPPCPSLDVIRQLTLPYLRQCALLKKLLSGTGQVLPVARAHLWELSQNSSTVFSRSTRDPTGGCSHEKEEVANELEELDQLESLFEIPPLTSLLTDESLLSVVLTWCHHARTAIGKEFHIKAYIPRPVRATPFKLMELPYLFQDLLQRYVKERCLRCGNIPEKPALCLLCGTLVCAITNRPCACSSLNKQGECYRHAMACGAGVGVFLMLRKTTILLQRCERQANWPSPYLDAFGEEDVEQRGKPLFLSEERYAALTAMVASHGLDYSSLVLAQTTRQTLF